MRYPAQVEEAVRAGVDIVLLDNAAPDQLRTAVKAVHGRAITEASGGVTLNTYQVPLPKAEWITSPQAKLPCRRLRLT
ncbi:MAG: hypothetical protein R2857_11160 [Vampirovibrionales bacterium]